LEHLGFTVKTIEIHYVDGTGKELPVNPKDVINIGLEKGDSIFKLSVQEIYDIIMNDSSIHAVIVKKKLPNSIIVCVTKKLPIAIFQHDNKFSLIDVDGSYIDDVTTKTPKLPIAVGEDANLHVKSMLDIIGQYDVISSGLESLVYIRKRRWNIVVSGITIKLPETNVGQPLNTLTHLFRQANINKKTVKNIDLRVLDSIIINGLKIKEKKL
jgi:cell division protein FtsQ